LARMKLAGIPPFAAGIARVAVSFQLDADGLLTVTAKEQATGHAQSIEVKPSYGLTDAEVEEMLMSSLDHAREDIEERLLIEKRVEAQRVMHATEKALQEDGALLNTEERAVIDAAMDRARAAIAGTDRHAVQNALEELDKATQEFAHRRMTKRIGQALENRRVEEIL
jgi:molecular chaperone HscA